MRELFEGKKVAFVGMAPNIEGKGLGALIDTYDVVYRTNQLPRNTKDYGSKCDVISVLTHHLHWEDWHRVDNVILFDDADSDKNKYIVTVEERKEIRDKYLNLYALDIRDATAGLVAYHLATKFGCKSFKFFGVTGYQNDKGEIANHTEVRHYIDQCFDDKSEYERALTVDMKNYDCHDFAAQNTIFKHMLKDGLFEMDQYSERFFKFKTE